MANDIRHTTKTIHRFERDVTMAAMQDLPGLAKTVEELAEEAVSVVRESVADYQFAEDTLESGIATDINGITLWVEVTTRG